jgi:ubiquinone biosynthesis protein Coq4
MNEMSPSNGAPAATPEVSRAKGMNEAERRYMQGDAQPVTSSVLISNSKYLNSPVYRDGWAQTSLRRLGHDISRTYHIPLMAKAIADVVDYPAVFKLLQAEREKNPEFAAWLDERRLTSYNPAEMQHYADGTLGAAIREFLNQPGFEMEFTAKEVKPANDLEYLIKRYGNNHDIDHLVTGFGPNLAGEEALAMASVTVASRFFTPELAQFITQYQVFVSAGAYKRNAIHYPSVMTTFLEAMHLGIAAGLSMRKPLFMVQWEDYLDWQLDDIAADLGFTRGPGAAWDWTTEAASG